MFIKRNPEIFQFRGDAKLAMAPWLVSLYLLVIKQLDKPLVNKAVKYFVQHSFTEFECELEEAWEKNWAKTVNYSTLDKLGIHSFLISKIGYV